MLGAGPEGPEGLSVARAVGRIADALAETRSRDCARFAVDIVGLRFMAFTDWFHHDTADVAFAVLAPPSYPDRAARGDGHRHRRPLLMFRLATGADSR